MKRTLFFSLAPGTGERVAVRAYGDRFTVHRHRFNNSLQPRPMIHLTTQRLILRDWKASDLDAWAAINADPEVRRHLGDGTPADRKDSWHMMAAAVGNQALNGFGMWAAEEKAGGTLIGRIGLYQPPHFPDLEVNWLLDRAWWGNGLAREGAEACIAHAFGRLGRGTISAFIEAGNERSVGLATRLGMKDAGEPWPGVRQFQRRRDR